jgi:hypothetical protein
MKKLIIIGAGLVIIILVAALSWQRFRHPSDDKLGRQVAGSWIREGPGTLTITPDGGFSSEFSMPDHTNIFTGTWQIADGVFLMTFTNASVPQARNLQTRNLIGRVERYKIVHVDDHKFMYEENGQIHTLNR